MISISGSNDWYSMKFLTELRMGMGRHGHPEYLNIECDKNWFSGSYWGFKFACKMYYDVTYYLILVQLSVNFILCSTISTIILLKKIAFYTIKKITKIFKLEYAADDGWHIIILSFGWR